MIRYLRAFFIALRVTLRGEPPPLPAYAHRYPLLVAWMQQATDLLEAVYAATAEHQLDRTAREAVTLHLDSRDMSMEVILSAIKYHLGEEYPHLLRTGAKHGITAIYATNLNDRYWMARLADAVSIAPVQLALRALSAHLDAIPSSSTPDSEVG